jgi:HEPN domain-containing protein
MDRGESLYPADWLRIAEKDLARVTKLLAVQDPEAAGLYLQQAVEKFLKAFLLSKGWQLKRIHDLDALLSAALGYDPSLNRFRPACQRITEYYSVERYPLLRGGGVTEGEVRASVSQVQELIQTLRAAIT